MLRCHRPPRTPGSLPGVFVCALTLLLTLSAQADDCAPTAALRAVRIDRVVDGDTLALTGGRRVRLIGVNAPETGHGGKPGEPLGQIARQTLAQWLPPGATVYLQPGRESRDHYGRELAHAFRSERGDSVEAALLQAGLAQHIVVPPNTDLSACLAAAESSARHAGRGLWSEAYFAPRDARALTRADAGYRRVRVKIDEVRRKGRGWWLETGGALVLRLDERDVGAFGLTPEQWVGRTLVVRGWIRDRSADNAVRRHGHAPLLLRLEHPVMVESGLRKG